MPPAPVSPIPEIFVLWHPACAIGDALARRIYAWLRPGNGLGPQVFYRSLPAPGSPEHGLPLPLPGEYRAQSNASASARTRVTNLQIVLPLVDENMVANPAWRHWLNELRTQSSLPFRREILPVALDATAYNLPGTLRDLNFLRPSGLPLPNAHPAIAAYLAQQTTPAVSPPPDPKRAAEVEEVVRSLLKQLTEALCRLLLCRPRDTTADPQCGRSLNSPKVSIFLSHAKSDGTLPARRLRDYIYSQTQLAAFYDENDIAFGSVFARVIANDLESPGTAALIAVRSARYARRPWCRRELALFRKPRREPQPPETPGERWRLYPVLMVEAMEGAEVSSSIPEFGNAPVLRWDAALPSIEEQIVTTIIRDATLASFHSALGAAIKPQANRIVLNWLPDPTTLLSIPEIQAGKVLDVVYPGQGISGLELDVLSEFFPALTFHSFEEILT